MFTATILSKKEYDWCVNKADDGKVSKCLLLCSFYIAQTAMTHEKKVSSKKF